MNKLTPPEFLGFTTSLIFLFVCGWLIWNAQQHLSANVLFWLGIATLAPLVPVPAIFVGFKLWAMFRVDTSGTKRQVSRARSTK